MLPARAELPRYQAYMLRLWQVRCGCPGQVPVWRFSLENAQTRKKRTFADLEALVAFLRAEMERDKGESA